MPPFFMVTAYSFSIIVLFFIYYLLFIIAILIKESFNVSEFWFN